MKEDLASPIRKPKILLIDIETMANVGYSWGKWQVDVVEFISHWYLLSVAYKWFGEKIIHVKALPDFKGYKPFGDDRELVKFVWELLDDADIVISHNGDEFDLKKLNTRFIQWNLPPPSPYKSIDTLKVVKSVFSFNSNKLDELGRDLGLGRKIEHEGFPLWLKCERGDMNAWNKIKKYNKRDVELLEKLYIKIRPYIKNHPNLDVFSSRPVCPKCGSDSLIGRGYYYTNTMAYKRYRCNNCGGWSRFVRGENPFLENKKKVSYKVSI
jgi:hypothetical protein